MTDYEFACLNVKLSSGLGIDVRPLHHISYDPPLGDNGKQIAPQSKHPARPKGQVSFLVRRLIIRF
jgi:hypothetical protein